MSPVLPTHDFQVVHGVNYPTFSPPCLDGSLTLAEIVDHHAQNSKNHVYATFKTAHGLRELTWGELGIGAHRAARALLQEISQPTVVAILANRDTLSYITLMLGVLRSGCVPVLLSPKNSAAGVAHLLKITEATLIYVSEGEAETQLVNEALADLPNIKRLEAPLFEKLYQEPLEEGAPLPPQPPVDPFQTAIVLHSSGSTAYPKSIPFTHVFLLQWIRSPMYGHVDLADQVVGLQAVPPFHASGFYQCIGVPACTGARVSIFPPQSPPVLATPPAVLASYKETGATFVITPPANLITWSHDEDDINTLVSLTKYVRNSGGPLPKAVGDLLARRGVNLYQGWGSTEIGPVTVTVQKEPYGLDWEWVQLQANTHPILEPQDDEGKNFELILQGTPTHILAVVTDKERNLYHTNDLVEKHPTKPGLIRIVGRKDDQIMLSTGEKTNPGPLENIIKTNPLVKACLYFGRERFQNGVLIEPRADLNVDPSDEEQLADFRNAVWQSIEEANTFAPRHSRVFKEMILVTSPGKPFFYTTKGSIARPRTIELYSKEIDQLYETVEASSSTTIKPPSKWSGDELRQYVNDIVSSVMLPDGGAVNESADLFLQGCDSLQATFIRNRLAAGLRQSGQTHVTLRPDLVYKQPSTLALTAFLTRAVAKEGETTGTEDASQVAQIVEDMIAKYSQRFPTHSGKQAPPSKESVLITGTTGNLGSYLLQAFAESSRFAKVYALNRSSKAGDLLSRQREALEDKGISGALLDSGKVAVLEADLTKPGLGLRPEVVQEIQSTVTLVIANAWRLDFNLGLGAFEPNIHSFRNLIDLALGSALQTPPRLINISSVSSVGSQKPSSNGTLLEVLGDKCESSPIGYGRSKYVSERIAAAASLPTCSIRVGQLSGSRTNGAWSTTDWLPLLVKSAEALKCLPQSNDRVNWVPLDAAARVVFEVASATHLPSTVHLVHPTPTAWNKLFEHIASQLKVPLVAFDDWLAKLSSSTDAAANPAIKLQQYFAGKAVQAKSTQPPTVFSTEKACELSGLGSITPLDERDAEAWLSYWQRKKFLS